jgi:ribosomal protein L37AE/L43A
VSDFVSAIWRCSGCAAELSLRYHLPTDGTPPDRAPEPWVTVEPDDASVGWQYYCPECSAPDVADEFESRTRSSMTEDEATAEHRREHICPTCIHVIVCRHAPGPDGIVALVTVSKCREWVPAID